MSAREDLIRDLYANIVGEQKKPEADTGSRYHADTNSLINDNVLNLTESNHRHEIMLESADYADIMMGVRSYHLCKDVGFLVNDVIAFRELNGLQITGNASLRTIAIVEKEVPGLAPGYCIVSWK